MVPPVASSDCDSLDSPTTTSTTAAGIHPALQDFRPAYYNKATTILDRRPKTSSAHHLSTLTTHRDASYESNIKKPLSAVPALGGAATSTTTTVTSPFLKLSPTWGGCSSTNSAEPETDDSAAVASPRSNSSQPSNITKVELRTGAARRPEPLMFRRPQVTEGFSDVGADTQRLTAKSEASPLSLDGMLSAEAHSNSNTNTHNTPSNPPLSAASLKLADALHNLARRRRSSATTTTALAALKSPCFYHQRFDDAVDIDKVLDEIKNDESMSHSRLVQTATSVREVSKQLQRRPIKRAVRNVMIVTKARDNQLVHLTRELAGWLLRTPRYGSHVGVNVYVDAKLRNSRRFDAPSLVAENPAFEDMLRYWTPDLCWSQPETFDLVLTLGGDGTVLFTSWLFQRIVPPVLSFSLGSLGFMTTFEFDKYKQHLNRVMGDDGMKINLRMRFTCTVWRRGALSAVTGEGEQFEVLNELVIDRGPSPYVSNLELYGDDELLTVVQADGCIFSTPTGSTAYSLSAGGSLVHPDIPAILLTPICPHTLSFRPMVLSDTMGLRVAVPHNSRATAHCAFDGKGRIELRQGDHVTITASQYPFPTVTRTDTEWFDSVSRTLRWNTRAASQKPFEDSGDCEGAAKGEEEDEGWDIDTDSAYYASEEGSVSTSPIRRQMSMLGL